MSSSSDASGYQSSSSSEFSMSENDMWSENEDVIDEEQTQNALFAFEPTAGSIEEERNENGDESGEDDNGALSRLNNTDWCSCKNCIPMDRTSMCVCCIENPLVREKLSECDGATFILSYPMFDAALLTSLTLDIAYLQFKQEAKERGWKSTSKFSGGNTNRRHRYVAYRQYVRWIHGVLGRNIRVPIPACVVNAVRKQFPLQSDDTHVGFHWAEEDLI